MALGSSAWLVSFGSTFLLLPQLTTKYPTSSNLGRSRSLASADIQGTVIDTFSDVSQLAWIGAGFPLGSVAVILPYGLAVCAAAPSMNALIVGRVIAGAGGTGIYLGSLNYFSELTTREERGTYLSGTGFVWGVGTILGPLLGGGFAVSPATWRWGFWINLVVGAVTAPIMLLYLPSIYPREESRQGTGRPTSTCVNLASRWALSRIKYYMPFLASGILLTVAGSLFYVYLKPSTPTADIYGFSVVMAVGNLRQVLAGRGLSTAELRDAVSGVHSAVFESLSDDTRDSAVAAISAAMQKSFVLVIIAGALEILSAFGMKFKRLLGDFVTM
ncbi:hypothetical protein DL768_010117 [Monosporascus sp. mg162]|nr:hypothetical protein DL768_010117 [Monosporascus sp. mg162]